MRDMRGLIVARLIRAAVVSQTVRPIEIHLFDKFLVVLEEIVLILADAASAV